MITALLDHKKLVEAMAEVNLTQEQFAEEIGITDRHVRNLRERDMDVSASLLYSMSRLLQVPMENLLIFRED